MCVFVCAKGNFIEIFVFGDDACGKRDSKREREHERVCSVNLLELESYIGHFFYAIDDGNGETSNQTNIKYLHL